jgi:hypothetical protein
MHGGCNFHLWAAHMMVVTSLEGCTRGVKRSGRPASPRPASLGSQSNLCRLSVDAPDCLMKSVALALVRSETVRGRAARPRLAGLGLSPLGPPFHRCVNQRLYFPPQVGLGLGSKFGHDRWTQLVMDQAFRS